MIYVYGFTHIKISEEYFSRWTWGVTSDGGTFCSSLRVMVRYYDSKFAHVSIFDAKNAVSKTKSDLQMT